MLFTFINIVEIYQENFQRENGQKCGFALLLDTAIL
jgi:hypothetical protein